MKKKSSKVTKLKNGQESLFYEEINQKEEGKLKLKNSKSLNNKKSSNIQKLEDLLKPETEKNLINIEKYIIAMKVSNTNKVENFVGKFITKYPDDYELQERLFKIILRKIETSENKDLFPTLKSEILFHTAKSIVASNKKEIRDQIKLQKLYEALDYLEQANILVDSFKNSAGKFDDKFLTDIESLASDFINNHNKAVEAFGLAKKSLETRQKSLPEHSNSILKALITAANIGNNIDRSEEKICALKYAKDAYNLSMYVGDKGSAISAIKIFSNIIGYFNDKLKENLLLEQVKNMQDDTSADEEVIQKIYLIKRYGDTNEATIRIKQKIQETTLKPIAKAAADGKWFNKILNTEYGVVGYLEQHLISSLKPGFTNDDIEIAKKLCFEAINLGIISSGSKNPICAVIFAQEYPDTMNKVLKENPEYFVNSYILRSVLPNAHEYAKDLLGTNIPHTSYNTYLESELIPLIEARMRDTTLNPIKKLVINGKWSKTVESNLVNYTTEEYLTQVGTFSTSNLGQNLSAVKNSVDIARMLIFKEVIAAVQESKSEIYSTVTVLVKTYPNIAKHILNNHHEYISSNHIKEIFNKNIPISKLEAKNPALVSSDLVNNNIDEKSNDVVKLAGDDKADDGY